MGCNCGKSSTISSARMSTTTMVASTEDSALVLGDPGGDVYRVRVVRPPAGLTVGQAAWVTGSAVPGLIAAGDLVDITDREQKRRIYTVGGMTYTSRLDAERVSSVTGSPVIEVA